MSPDDAAALAEIQSRSYARPSGFRETWPREHTLDANGLADFLDAHVYCVLATSRPDGRPQATPISFLVTEGVFWFASQPGARLRNLRATPYASFVLAEGGRGEHTAVAAEGPVMLHEPDAVPGIRAAWAARVQNDPVWAAAFFELRPRLLFSHRNPR